MTTIDEYYNDFEKEQEKFHKNMHEYPLFQEMIDQIYDKDIKEVNELLDKNDEYYLKKAIRKLENINDYIKETSQEIDKLYKEYDKYARIWNDLGNLNTNDKILDDINSRLKNANELIKSHNLNDLKEANQIMNILIKEAKKYK